MKIYKVRGPDGKIYDFEGPSGLSKDGLMRFAMMEFESMAPVELPPEPKEPEGESGFIPAFKSSVSGLYSDLATLAGRTGIIDESTAERVRREEEEYQRRTFKPTEEGWTEAPWTKFKELLGQSAPYMIGPAGAGLLTRGAGALATLGATGLTSAAQFTGSNLSRQIEEGRKLSETDFGNAFLASIPQAALDTLSLRMIPGVRGIFGTVGKEMTEAQANAFIQQTIKDKLIDYGIHTGKTATVEGATEAAQQLFERLQAGLSITDADAQQEYFDNFLGGTILGGALSVPGRFAERVSKRAEAETKLQGAEVPAATDEELARAIDEAQQARVTPLEDISAEPIEQGAPDVGQPDTGTGGVSVPSLVQPGDALAPAAGTEEPIGGGVGAAGQDVGAPLKREGKKSRAVTEVSRETSAPQTPMFKYINGISKPLDRFYDDLYRQDPQELPDNLREVRNTLDRVNEAMQVVQDMMADHPINKAETPAQRAMIKSTVTGIDSELLGAPGQMAAIGARIANQAMAISKGYKGKKAGSPEKIEASTKEFYDYLTKVVDLVNERERGLKEQVAPEEQPAVAPTPAEPTEPKAPKAQKASDQIMGQIRALEDEQQKLLSKDGRIPAVNSKKRQEWDRLGDQIDSLKSDWAAADRAERGETKPKVAPPDVVEDASAIIDDHNKANPKDQIPAFNELSDAHKAKLVEATKADTVEAQNKAAKEIASELKQAPEHVQKQAANNNLRTIFQYLKTPGKLPFHVLEVIKRIEKIKGFSPKIKVVESLSSGNVAEYDPETNTITLTKAGTNTQTLAHELVHAATIHVLNEYEKDGKLTDEQRDAAEHLNYLMNLTRGKLADKFSDAYKNVYEFASEALTNEEFQKELDKISVPRNEAISPSKSMWSDFVTAIAKLLGWTGDQTPTALMEAVKAFDWVASAPKGGVKMAPLAQTTVKAPPVAEGSGAQRKAAYEKQVEIKKKGAAPMFKRLMTKEGYDYLVRKLANSRESLRRSQIADERLGLIETIGEKLNNVYDQLTLSIGRGVNIYDSKMRFLVQDLETAIGSYAEKFNLTVDQALGQLHLILEAKHEPERRFVKFLLTVPLDDQGTTKRYKLDKIMGDAYKDKTFSADAFRQEILNILSTNKKYDPVTIAKLRAGLEKVVNDAASDPKLRPPKTSDADYDRNNSRYSVIGDGVSAEGRSSEEIRDIARQFSNEANSKEFKAIEAALEKVKDETKSIDRGSYYWSQPTDNVVEFYGYKNYVPFKGRKGKRTIDEQLEIGSRVLGGEMQDYAYAFEGRKSESENPVLQMLADAHAAALRAGRTDLTRSIKNAVLSGTLKGKITARVDFKDRYLDRKTKEDIGGQNKIFHYEPDGTISVIQLDNQQQAEAIRRSYRVANPLIDAIDRITGFIGQGHTRFNPAFGPVNFVTDMLTNAWNLGATYGPSKSFQLIRQIANDVFFNGAIQKAGNYAWLMSKKGGLAQIEQLAGGNKPYEQLSRSQQYYRDLKEYVEMGGKVSYLAGVSSRGAEERMVKNLTSNKLEKVAEGVTEYVDMYNDMLELTSRVSAYRTLRAQFFADNKQSGKYKTDAEAYEAAKVKATAETKNLANFEQTGEWGKVLGAMFMFFRPSATGAVRAIESFMPALRLYGIMGTVIPGRGPIADRVEGFRNEYRQRLKDSSEKLSDAEIEERTEKAVKNILKEANNARHMAMSLVGMGMAAYMASYMMAGDDDEGRNKVAVDDSARWVRSARFFLPWSDNPIQVRWGFGHGAFASIGAQLAALTMGKDSAATIFDNIRSTLMDNYLPLPVSRINMFEHPIQFLADTINPSITRPLFEYVMNLDGLGRQIYNDRLSRYGNAYLGSDSTPPIWKDAARMIFDLTHQPGFPVALQVDPSPNTMAFLASNYVDGMGQLASMGYGLIQMMSGQKDFDPRNDVPFVRGFIGTPSNIDAREFGKIEDKLKDMQRKLNTMKESRPDMYQEYIDANPEEAAAVKFYNLQINRGLKKVNQRLNDVRAMPSSEISFRDRKEELDTLKKEQNAIKRQLIEVFREEFGIQP